MSIDSLFDRYALCYEEDDAEAVASLCEVPFLAVRGDGTIHLGDREAVVRHFADIFATYRGLGVTTWSATSIVPQPLGRHAAFATVRWHALGAGGEVLRDNEATYHLLAGVGGWRYLSYTFHG